MLGYLLGLRRGYLRYRYNIDFKPNPRYDLMLAIEDFIKEVETYGLPG